MGPHDFWVDLTQQVATASGAFEAPAKAARERTPHLISWLGQRDLEEPTRAIGQ